jgi:hypothetical protein
LQIPGGVPPPWPGGGQSGITGEELLEEELLEELLEEELEEEELLEDELEEELDDELEVLDELLVPDSVVGTG